jgi:hypothetical protein
MSRWQAVAVWLVLVAGVCLGPGPAGAQEIAQLLPQGPRVADATASGGRLVAIDLAKARPGPVASIPLAGKRPGKYVATLRVKLTPVDSYADVFVLSAGDGARAFMGPNNPDPRNSDYRLWVLPFVYDGKGVLDLKVALDRPGGMQDRPARQLLLDRLDLKSIGPVYIESIRPNKVCYDPNEEIACAVVLHPPQVGMQVRAVETLGLAASREVARGAAGADGKLTLKWNAGPEQYGREVRVELVQDGKVIDSAADDYNVTDNVWKVALAASVAGMHMSDPRSVHCGAKTDAQLAENINVGTRATYGNFKESFAWAPDDAFGMTPTQEFWISGQGSYQHQRSRILLMNKLLRDNGIWPITYAKSAASGPPVFEFMRKHPDFALTMYQAQFDQELVEKWDQQVPGKEKTIFYAWLSCVVNIAQPKIVDAAINEILSSAQMFGWRGARYDDHYSLWGQPESEVSTRNMERIFALGKQRDPGFVWGFNYLTSATPFGWPRGGEPAPPWKQAAKDAALPADPANPRQGAMPATYPEFAVACRNGGYIMNEEARGAWQGSGGAGTYTHYAQLLTYEARLTRGLGGHYGPIPFDPGAHSAFDAIYPDLLRCASRSHTYGQVRGGVEMLRFLTRYSALLYGTSLEPIADPEPLLRVEAQPGVWWHNYCYRYQDGAAKKVVVHLLAVPRSDRIFGNKDGEVSRVRGCSVTYAGPEAVVKAYELSPFLEGFCRELPVTGKSVQPSDFQLWTMVVLELGDGQ